MSGSEIQPGNDLIAMEEICRSYIMGEQHLSVLDSITLKIQSGESCAVVGSSGSGKSTLLNILGLLDQPTSGRYLLNGQDMTRATQDERANLRNQLMGFVFQSFNLLPKLSALDNVALPLLYRGHSRQQARQLAYQHIEQVGLVDRASHRPADLSGGQRQRIAIARALVGKPALILADEPTGNLDSSTAQNIMDLLLELNQTQAVTLIMVTHDVKLAQQLSRRLYVQNGRITEAHQLRNGLDG
jgi:putative ABC transport system ATP-binding protein